MTQILRDVHDELGHNGSTRVYMLVHRLYYWKGLKSSVNKQIMQCITCQKRKHTSGKICSTTLYYHEAADAIYFNGLNWPLGPFY